VKDQIKALGGRWDADAKGWNVPSDKADAARALLAGAPKSAPRRSNYDANRFTGYGRKRGGYVRNQDDECELCGKNKFTCGHCIGW
jgi:hypothetical protein